MSRPKKPALVKKKRAGKPSMQELPAIHETNADRSLRLDARGRPRIRDGATDAEKSQARSTVLEAFGVDSKEPLRPGPVKGWLPDKLLASKLHEALKYAEQFGKAERVRTETMGWSTDRDRASNLLLWSQELREWADGAPRQKMPPPYYLMRAIDLGAALAEAGVFYEAGPGGRKPGSGHDNTWAFEIALPLIERDGKLIGAVFLELAKRAKAEGRKHGKVENVAAVMQKAYGKWRKGLSPERVSILSNPMTCPTCGAKVRADLH